VRKKTLNKVTAVVIAILLVIVLGWALIRSLSASAPQHRHIHSRIDRMSPCIPALKSRPDCTSIRVLIMVPELHTSFRQLFLDQSLN